MAEDKENKIVNMVQPAPNFNIPEFVKEGASPYRRGYIEPYRIEIVGDIPIQYNRIKEDLEEFVSDVLSRDNLESLEVRYVITRREGCRTEKIRGSISHPNI